MVSLPLHEDGVGLETIDFGSCTISSIDFLHLLLIQQKDTLISIKTTNKNSTQGKDLLKDEGVSGCTREVRPWCDGAVVGA